MIHGTELFVALLNNLAIFIALIAVYRYLLVRFDRPTRPVKQLVFGLVFGLFAMGVMMARIPVYEGVIVDQRNAVIALSGAFGGPLAALVSAAMAGLFRAILGGGGVLAGVIGVGLAAAAGILLHVRRDAFTSGRASALSAVMATIIILPGFLFVDDLQTGWALLRAMTLPYGSAVFLGIFFVGLLLEHQVERHQVERALRESEEKYRVLFESFPLGIAITDEQGRVVETNAASDGSGSVGITDAQVYVPNGHTVGLLSTNGEAMAPDELPGLRAIRENQIIKNEELGVVEKNGETRWLSATAAPIPLEGYGAAVTYNDVSDRREAEQQTRQALGEKSLLLQELFHRTRNSMQLIVALLDWQAQHVEDDGTRSILHETQNRIRTMALVHQKLYQSQDLSYINLGRYIVDLVELLKDAYAVDPDWVDVQLDIQDVYVLIDTAIPFGLVFEEVVTNAFRHAFAQGRTGRLKLHLHRDREGQILLRVSDNGVGLAPGFDPRTDGRLGLQMIFALSEQQLGGQTDITSVDGVTFSLRFTDDLYSPRV